MLKVEFGWDYYHTFLVIIVATILFQLGHQIAGDEVASPVTSYPMARPGCPEKCGDVVIPYPFGIGDECHYDHSVYGPFYNITCNNTIVIPTFGDNIEIEKITLDGEIWLRNNISYICYNSDGSVTRNYTSWLSVERFALSTTQNVAGAIGCDTVALFGDGNHNTNIDTRSGCITVCDNTAAISDDGCTGKGCCSASIPDKITNLTLIAQSIFNHTHVYSFNPCSVAFVVAKDQIQKAHLSIKSTLKQDFTYFNNPKDLLYPTVYNWSIGDTNTTCKNALASGEYLCKGNTFCLDDLPGLLGYRCQCKPGFEGNPYLRDCQDIDECKLNSCEKPEYCNNTLGSYSCTCPKGYYGNATKDSPCFIIDRSSQRNKILVLTFKIIIVSTLLTILLPIFGWWLYSVIKRRQAAKQRQINFERNGGMLLQQQMSSPEGIVERIKIFTIDELKKATDNFNINRILGQGGQGTVYKGMLSEGRIVAVKKSNKLEGNQGEEFINEVVVLSQINHRNILKLLGCCLETEVPLLAYEFIPNGTLFDHIHNPSEEFPITWKMRLQIASDSAGALAYLHSSTSSPIFHRDIKSSNILLDDKYRAKLSDFGTSRSVAIDQTHVVTRVLGTFGYLDPEYYQTHQFSEKSDVYSFGVVLVELLTGQKAIRATCKDERSLTSWFLSHMDEDSSVLDIIDYQVLQEGSKEEFMAFADLAKRCLNIDGKIRPTMKEVLLEIEAILSRHIPRMNRPKSEQVFAGTNKSVNSPISTFSLESRVLDSGELSLLFNPR